MAKTRVKYDGLAPGTHTWGYTEDRSVTVPEANHPQGEVYRVTGQPDVFPGDVLEVEDLDDPRSERARIVRGHIEAGVAHVIEGKGAKKPQPSET
jgi:hypothetical protein